MAVRYPVVPSTITVHLGAPDSDARNITVPFTDYISNVAANELYPTWPKAALTANIYAIISFAMNRIYNEWYRSKGYNFDITSSPAYDQAFKENRSTYENIDNIVSEIFNNYVVKGNQIQPYFTTYCDGRQKTCDGLSQWGTVSLANQGKTPLQILKYYYGNDVPKDRKIATEWYLSAAQKGNDKAQNQLGLMYENGDGVKKNEAKSIKWYKKAAEQGHTMAIQKLERLSRQ